MKKGIKITWIIGCMVLGLSFLSVSAMAETDFSSMTNEELSAMRGTVRDADQVDRDAFRAEWLNRTKSMTPEEKQRAFGRPENAAQDGNGYKTRTRNQTHMRLKNSSGSGSGGSGKGGSGKGRGHK
jgi:hypothetical protein